MDETKIELFGLKEKCAVWSKENTTSISKLYPICEKIVVGVWWFEPVLMHLGQIVSFFFYGTMKSEWQEQIIKDIVMTCLWSDS